MGLIKGTDFMFYVTLPSGQEMFCHATDFQLSVATDVLETTGPNNGSWKSFRPGLLTYTISAPGIVSYTDPLNYVQFRQIQDGRQIVDWMAGTSPSGGVQYSGQMFITATSLTSQMNDAVKFDLSGQGTGPQLVGLNLIIKTVYLSDFSGGRLAGCPNPYPVGVFWYDNTFIGVAASAAQVVSLFNQYSDDNSGSYLHLTGTDGGCNFTMTVAWNNPDSLGGINGPDTVLAVPGAGFAMMGGADNEAIGVNNIDNNVIGV